MRVSAVNHTRKTWAPNKQNQHPLNYFEQAPPTGNEPLILRLTAARSNQQSSSGLTTGNYRVYTKYHSSGKEHFLVQYAGGTN